MIRSLLKERPEYQKIEIPHNGDEQKTAPQLDEYSDGCPVSEEFQRIQDEYLQEENRNKGIIDISHLTPIENEIYLWRDDITRLACGAIVNAANSGMTGCYQPCHNCIDNCIHTYAGVQLRNYCNVSFLSGTGRPEPSTQYRVLLYFHRGIYVPE